MTFDILTIFPKAFTSYFDTSILARAQAKKFIKISTHDLRKYARDKHHTVDDRPYGGGAGMVTRADVVFNALDALKKRKAKSAKQKIKEIIILLTPQGKVFNQKHATRLSKYDRIILVSGRYEGFDDRIRHMVDEEISIGDYVLSGGELPAMVVVDAVSRLIPGVLGKESSLAWESFSTSRIMEPELKKQAKSLQKEIPKQILEYPQYTRPERFKMGTKIFTVPAELLSGNHEKIFRWRLNKAIKKTVSVRPDLLK
jgi:tRNA (guanine37-N1)-methyltransferase